MALAVACASIACGPPPSIAHAQLLEHGASWAASVVLAGEMEAAGRAPHAYVSDLIATAAKEVAALRDKVEEESDLPPSARSEAATSFDLLLSTLKGADSAHARPDAGRLRDLEHRLRESAARARAASGGFER